jgi:hypothetical protein
MNHSARVLPRWIFTPAVGWIASVGQAGSALLPFVTGVVAARVGIIALQPMWVAFIPFRSAKPVSESRQLICSYAQAGCNDGMSRRTLVYHSKGTFTRRLSGFPPR